jgi:enamine deaminase RidA (YjgF/YER057c/UK114 family)
MSTHPEDRLREMGLELPALSESLGTYEKGVISGTLLFLSGQGPRRPGEIVYRGKVGREYTLAEGYEAARFTMLALLATLRKFTGNLDNIRRVVRVTGYVNCTEDFVDHPKVINGASDLLVAIYGDRGRHARTALGVAQLPNGIPVEIEMIVELPPR